MRSKISSKLIFASCVWYSDRAHYELCVLIKDIGRIWYLVLTNVSREYDRLNDQNSTLQAELHLVMKVWADDKKRYTNTISRHRAVHSRIPSGFWPRSAALIVQLSWLLTPTSCGTSYRTFSARPSPFLDATHNVFGRKIQHADRLCPGLFTT